MADDQDLRVVFWSLQHSAMGHIRSVSLSIRSTRNSAKGCHHWAGRRRAGLDLVDKDFFPAKIDFIDNGSPMNKYIEVAKDNNQ